MHYLKDVLVALAGATALALASGCDKQVQSAAAPQFPPPLVTVTSAVARDVPVYLDEIGKCTALESVTITPRVAGLITSRHFEDGADLTKGQLLFTIDTRPYEAALHAAEAQLAQSRAALAFANIELKRWAAVADTRAVSKSDYDTKKNAVELAEAQVKSAGAAVETAELNLDYCTIHSPIDGRAGARLMDVGNVVKADEGSLLMIQHLDPIYADFTVNERELAQVRSDMARGTLKTLVKLPTDSSAGREGDLIFLDNAVQDATGTVRLRALLHNRDRHFWPGQFVNVRLVLRIHKDAVLVNGVAPQIGQQGPYVFVVKPVNNEYVAEQRPVVLGQRQGDMIVIDHGLKAGEMVVAEGQMMVVPAKPVRLASPPPQPTPSGTARSDQVDQQATAQDRGGKPAGGQT